MLPRLTILVAIAAALLVINTGCTTTGGSSDGWIVVDPYEKTPPPPPPPRETKPPESAKKNKGQKRAGIEHLRNAYRFLGKNKADHALKELGKARYRLGADFRVYYYVGGAYFYKGMYKKALDSWQTARRYTRNVRLRSRLRTCQAYAIIHLEGYQGAIPFLDKAIDLDEKNRHARELKRSLERSMETKWRVRKGNAKNSRQPSEDENAKHSRYAEEMIRKKNDPDNSTAKRNDDESYSETRDHEYRDWETRNWGNWDREDSGWKDEKPGKKEKKQKKKRNDKKPDMDIRDLDQFKRYFLIEMF